MTLPRFDDNEKIDGAVAVIDALVKLGGLFFWKFRLFEPIIMNAVIDEANQLKSGLKAGTIVSDGHWGYVPSDNSRYDPKTGKFL